jgi:hypothetical protein
MSKLEEKRDAYVYIATGMKKVGKTYRTMQEVKAYVMDDPRNGRKGRKALIFDTNMEYEGIPSIDFDIQKENEMEVVKHVVNWDRVEIRRVLPFRKDGMEMNVREKQRTVELLLKYYRNGLFVIEDLNSFSLGARSIEMIGTITTNRHKSQDIIIHLQSTHAIDPRLYQNLNILRMHQDTSPIEKISKKVDNFELYQIAKECVEIGYTDNRYFYVYIENQFQKINGNCLTRQIFTDACKEVAKRNPKILKRFLRLSDKLNEANIEKAATMYAHQSMKYYGNSK